MVQINPTKVFGTHAYIVATKGIIM